MVHFVKPTLLHLINCPHPMMLHLSYPLARFWTWIWLLVDSTNVKVVDRFLYHRVGPLLSLATVTVPNTNRFHTHGPHSDWHNRQHTCERMSSDIKFRHWEHHLITFYVLNGSVQWKIGASVHDFGAEHIKTVKKNWLCY